MKIRNKIITLLALMAAILMYSSTTSNAALQANGKSVKTDTINNWLINIRRMEATGGTLGLTDTIGSNLASSASTSNNLDIHMELNTEYGAMAILSASSYGNQNKIGNGETTTGNKSGVYITIGNNGEWVSAGCNELGSSVANFENAVSKYKNIYTISYSAKIGDAIGDTNGWHGGSVQWLGYKSSSGLLRAFSGSVFSYNGSNGSVSGAHYTLLRGSRAVVVVGSGL